MFSNPPCVITPIVYTWNEAESVAGFVAEDSAAVCAIATTYGYAGSGGNPPGIVTLNRCDPTAPAGWPKASKLKGAIVSVATTTLFAAEPDACGFVDVDRSIVSSIGTSMLPPVIA